MERYLIAAFRSRTHTMRFFEKLKGMKVKCAIINTPREAQVGCGISVKFPPEGEAAARTLISRGEYPTFSGFFMAVKEGNTQKIYKF